MNFCIVFGQQYFGATRAFTEIQSIVNNSSSKVFFLVYNTENRSEIIEEGFLTTIKYAHTRWSPKIFAVNNSIPIFTYLWSKRIKSIIEKEKIDHIIVHDIFMIPAALRAMKQGQGNYTLSVNLHEDYPTVVKTYSWASKFPNKFLARPEVWKEKEGQLLRRVDKIILLSDFFKKRLLEEYPFLEADQFFVQPNVPDVEKLESYGKSDVELVKGTFKVLYFGVIGVRRGIMTLLTAANNLHESIPDLEVVLIGPVDGADKEVFQAMFDESEVKVTHIPWIDMPEFPSYVDKVDVCISPLIKNDQHESGIANKVFQYMWAGKPVIVSNCKPQADLILESTSGVVFRSEDVQDLEEKILQLYADPERRKEMGENGRQAIHSRYNLVNYSKRLSAFLHDIK